MQQGQGYAAIVNDAKGEGQCADAEGKGCTVADEGGGQCADAQEKGCAVAEAGQRHQLAGAKKRRRQPKRGRRKKCESLDAPYLCCTVALTL